MKQWRHKPDFVQWTYWEWFIKSARTIDTNPMAATKPPLLWYIYLHGRWPNRPCSDQSQSTDSDQTIPAPINPNLLMVTKEGNQTVPHVNQNPTYKWLLHSLFFKSIPIYIWWPCHDLAATISRFRSIDTVTKIQWPHNFLYKLIPTV